MAAPGRPPVRSSNCARSAHASTGVLWLRTGPIGARLPVLLSDPLSPVAACGQAPAQPPVHSFACCCSDAATLQAGRAVLAQGASWLGFADAPCDGARLIALQDRACGGMDEICVGCAQRMQGRRAQCWPAVASAMATVVAEADPAAATGIRPVWAAEYCRLQTLASSPQKTRAAQNSASPHLMFPHTSHLSPLNGRRILSTLNGGFLAPRICGAAALSAGQPAGGNQPIASAMPDSIICIVAV